MDKRYKINCQRCVQAYDLRRRGYDVTALGELSAKNQILWGHESLIDSTGKPLQRYPINLLQTDIIQTITAAGDGARFGIYCVWKKTGRAHVFCAENVKGVIKFVDPQSGKTDSSAHLAKAIDGRFGIWRMDDKDITEDYTLLRLILEAKKK